MDTIVESPSPDDANQVLNLVDPTVWTTDTNSERTSNNSTMYYIAVEYVTNFKSDDQQSPTTIPIQPAEVFNNDFNSHVSPLDPNMSSVARYSPVYNELSNSEFNPVVIHQLVSDVQDSSLENIPATLTSTEVNDHYLHEIVENSDIVSTNTSNSTESFLVNQNDQGVELLITDQSTGISYSVNTQELLVGPLPDEQLLENLTHDPLVDPDPGLKAESLNDDLIINAVASEENDVSSFIDSIPFEKNLDCLEFNKTRQQRNQPVDPEEQLLSCVYMITDKPVQSRARATLPESYLVINKVDDEDAVFAKKTIPMRTQFGPLEGTLEIADENIKPESCYFQFLLKHNDDVLRIDVTDESISNWMCFVRKAVSFEEQNLVLSQENTGLYFTTTKNILPKQELKFGYSSSYAQTHKLAVLEPKVENTWPCFECPAKFATSEDLQQHLNIHDDEKNENVKPRRKILKSKGKILKKRPTEVLECNLCHATFAQFSYKFLKKHLMETHNFSANSSVEENFSIVTSYKCDSCDNGFKSESLLRIHKLEHDPDSADEQITNHICPSCQRKFPTQRQLVIHVLQHALPKKVVQFDYVVCPICKKNFAQRERLQKHMMVHGSDELKPLQCKTCKKRFMNNSALSCHVKTHFAGANLFECPICKERFDHVLKLKLHVPKHCENNQFTCPHCKKIFKKYCVIRKHIRAFHCERKHVCQQCSKMFPTVDKLRMHMLRHSDKRDFLCADCGKQFKRKDKLKEHCKRLHSEDMDSTILRPSKQQAGSGASKKPAPKTEPTDFHRFIYKCHSCLVGFKRRGMLVNHLAKRHPDIRPDSVPELNLPILQTTRDYYCQYCDKVYKSSSKRKAHILKNHPGAALPMSNRGKGSLQEVSHLPNPTFSQTVGSITTRPQSCMWCHKQYASKAKLVQHQRKKHSEELAAMLGQDKSSDKEDNPAEQLGKFEEVMIADACAEDADSFEKISGADVENLVSDFVEEESQYCNLMLNENGYEYIASADMDNPASHLYRLLTTSNGLLPPR